MMPSDNSICVSSLEGEDLNYWVARAQGWKPGRRETRFPNAASNRSEVKDRILYKQEAESDSALPLRCSIFDFSTRESLAWPIIKAERMTVMPRTDTPFWTAYIHGGLEWMASEPLVAAMRCYVAKTFGDTVPFVISDGEWK